MAHAPTRALYGAPTPPAAPGSSSKSVIVHAPQGAGKGLHAEELRRGFGLSQVDDEWDGRHFEPTGVLYLTVDVPARFSSNRRVFSLKEALAHVRRKA